MPEVRRFGLLDFLALLLVLGVAVAGRVGYLAVYCDNAQGPGPLRVQDETPELADLVKNLKEKDEFKSVAPFAPGEEVTSHTAPAYPYLLGVAARFVAEADFAPAVRWAQAGLGSLAAGFVFLFGRRAFRSLFVGTLAGLGMAAWPFAIVATAALTDGTLATFLMAAVLWFGARAGGTGGPMASFLFGLLLAGLALTRPALLPFAAVCLGWLMLRTRDLPSGWLAALVAFLGFVGGLAPWAIRTYQLHDEPVPVVSTAYYEVWVGNNPAATGGPETTAMLATDAAVELKLVAKQPDRYARLGKEIAQEVTTAPEATVQRRLNALLFFLFGQRWFTDRRMADHTGETVPQYAELALTASLLGVLLLAFLGWRWSFGYRVESVPAMLAMLLVPLPYILSHAMALHGPRLPLDAVLVPFAAFGFSTFLLAGWLTEPQPEDDGMFR